MAKKTNKILPLRQIIEKDGEAWSEVSYMLCQQCGIGTKKPRRDSMIYIQGEDMGCYLDDKLVELGYAPRYTQHEVPNFKAWLKGDSWPAADELPKLPKSKSLVISYDTDYTLVLKNNGDGYAGCTYGVLVELVDDAIRRMDVYGEGELSTLQSLLVIQEQLRVEFNKYDEGRN